MYIVNRKNEATLSFDVCIFLCVDGVNMRRHCVFCLHMHKGMYYQLLLSLIQSNSKSISKSEVKGNYKSNNNSK